MVTHAQPTSPASKTVLFHRDMRAFSGGHLKVFHYFTHVRDAPGYEARVAFSDRTIWDASNPWLGERDRVEDAWAVERGDIIFVAGMDWQVALAGGLRESGKPVINLIQHVRHADPDADVHRFLREPAVRICVSQEVESAILDTGKVQGPTHVIPNGIEPEPLGPGEWRPAASPRTVLVVGTKNQRFAAELAAALRADGVDTVLHDRFVARASFLDTLTRFGITVFCPDPTEGFYLPALEGMNRGTLVICPDCVGNRGFCTDGQTCLAPAYTLDAMTTAVRRALGLSVRAFDDIRLAASTKAAQHSLTREREGFLSILDDVAKGCRLPR